MLQVFILLSKTQESTDIPIHIFAALAILSVFLLKILQTIDS